MRKSEIEKLRQSSQDAKKRALDALEEGKRGNDAGEASKSVDAGNRAGNIELERFQALIYANLVGSSDFLRTQAGVAEICRTAYARSVVAVRIWLKEKGTTND